MSERRGVRAPDPTLREVLLEWGRIGCIGYGGPPAHVALLRELCVNARGWLSAEEFEDGVATTNLLPGPASTQVAIYYAWRARAFALTRQPRCARSRHDPGTASRRPRARRLSARWPRA